MNNQTHDGASAPSTDHEARLEALRAAIETGKMGIGGAIASYPELTISQIVAVAAQVVKGRAS